MKINTCEKLAVICEENGRDFENRFNERMAELKKHGPRYELDKSRPFLAYIFYTVEEYTPETITEAHELVGDVHYCDECACYQAGNDKRRKWNDCLYKGCKVHAEQRACDWLYKRLEESGVI